MSRDSYFQYLPREDTLMLREAHVAGACRLHFGQNPLKIVRSQGQFLYDDIGQEYLDCCSRITNVGHCHQEILEVACRQLGRFTACNVESVNNDEQIKYCQRLLNTLPDNFQVCLFTNSGSEANDLALQLARAHTGRQNIVVVDAAYHGTVNLLLDISPRAFMLGSEKKPWVHVIPFPDTYRGKFSADDPQAAQKYAEAARAILEPHRNNIATLICEPVFVVHGAVVPPPGWLGLMYDYIREIGGVVIADEIQCGMGRTGSHFWAFQTQGAIPDIITVGKPMGNGMPIGAVITSRKIAECLNCLDDNRYQCDPVSAVVGQAVLNIMEKEQCQLNALTMGRLLVDRLTQLQRNHPNIGLVRGIGLMIGVDIVWCQESRRPAPELAEKISYRMKEAKIIVANEGENGNVLLFLPAMCLTTENVLFIVSTLNRILSTLQMDSSPDIMNLLLPQTSDNLIQQWPDSSGDSDTSSPAASYNAMD
uniref:Ethanolamine-phosphate phospho-lyase n=2 Tax=Cacopsylla melanoneura TaxID=428564 RepID=A0A8D8S0G3_9HEMI